MKRYFNYTLVLAILLACFTFGANAQNVQVESRLDKVSMPIGDQTVLHVVAHIPAKSAITFPLIADSIGKIQIVKSLKPDTTFDKNNPNAETISHDYTITSFDTGVYVLPQFEFRTKTDSFKTGTVTLQIKSVPVDTTKAFYDIKQPFAVSYNFFDWLKDHWIWVASGLAIILLVTGLIYYFKKMPKKEIAVIKTAPALPAYTIALNKLYELRDKKLWQSNEVKLYHSELTDVLREYLEKRYQVKAHEQTTDEIFAGLKKKDINTESRNKLKQVLTLADLVKFAKEKPLPADNEQSMENAIVFVMQTTLDVQAADNNKEELPQ